MPPENRDAAWLWDMLEAARWVTEFTKHLSCEDFLSDERTQAAVERKVEIIGEAARKVSDEIRAAHSEIQWKSVVGLRNILAHQYDDIIAGQMWLVTQEHIPKLIAFLESLSLPEEGEKER